MIGSFTHQLHDELALAGAVVEIDKDDLLPRAQRQAAIDKWHGKRRPEQRRAHVGVTIAVAPACVVRIGAIGVGKLIEETFEIADAACLVFERGQRAGGRRREEGNDAILQPTLGNKRCNLLGNFEHVGITLSVKLNGLRFDSHMA